MARDNIEVYAIIDLDEYEKGLKEMEKKTLDMINKIQNIGNIHFKIDGKEIEMQTKKASSKVKESVENLNKNLEEIKPKLTLEQFKKDFEKAEIYARDTKVKIDNNLLFDLKLKSVQLEEELKAKKQEIKDATSVENKMILTLEAKNIRSNLTEVNRQIRNVENTGVPSLSRLQMKFDKVSDSIGGAINKVKNFGLSFLAFDKIKDIFGSVFSAGARFEQVQISFTTMLGSGEKAKQLLQDLTDFAIKTPFDIPGLRDVTTQLIAFGFEQNEIIPSLKMLGDVAAGTSKPIEQIAYAYGQVKTAGQLYGTELMQFTNAGVPLLRVLAKQFNVTEAEMKKMVSAGKVGFKDVELAFKTMTSEGGAFYNLTENQSESLTGKWNALKEKAYALAETIGTALVPILKGLIDFVVKTIEVCQNWSTLILALTISITGLIGAKGLMGLFGILTKIIPAVKNLAIAKGALTVANGALSISFRGLAAAIWTMQGPLIAITGLIWAAIKAYQKLNEYREADAQLKASIENGKRIEKESKEKIDKDITETKKSLEEAKKSGNKKEIEYFKDKLALDERRKIHADILFSKNVDLVKLNKDFGDLGGKYGKLKERRALLDEEKKLNNLKNGNHLNGISTLDGYSQHLGKLQEEIKKAEIGSEKFKSLQKGIADTQRKISEAEGKNITKGIGGSKQKQENINKETEAIKKRYKIELEEIDKLSISEEEKAQKKKKVFEKIQKEIDKLKKDSFELEKEQNEELMKLQKEAYDNDKKNIDEGYNIAQKYYDGLIEDARKYQDELDKILEKKKKINEKMEEAGKTRAEKLADRYVKIDEELRKIEEQKNNLTRGKSHYSSDFSFFSQVKQTNKETLKSLGKTKYIGDYTGDDILKLKEIIKQEEKLKREQEKLTSGKKSKYNKDGFALKGTDIADAGRRKNMTDSDKIFENYNKEMEKLEKEMQEIKKQEAEKQKLYDETIKWKEIAEKAFTGFIKNQTTERIGDMEKMRIKAQEIAEQMAALGFTGQGFKANFIKQNADGSFSKETKIINYNTINQSFPSKERVSARDVQRGTEKGIKNTSQGIGTLTTK